MFTVLGDEGVVRLGSFFALVSGAGLYRLGFDRRLTVSMVNALALPRACRREGGFGSSLLEILTCGGGTRLFEVDTKIFESETTSVVVPRAFGGTRWIVALSFDGR